MKNTQLAVHPVSSFRSLWGLAEGSCDSTEHDKQDDFLDQLCLARRTGTGTVRIIHTNDAHHFHLGSRPAAEPPNPDNGGHRTDVDHTPIGALADLLANARAASHNRTTDLLYLSAGDEHTGTSLDELLGYTPARFHTSAGYAVQSAVGLDVATIGNHDLDRGPQILQQAIEHCATFPVLSANICASRYLTGHYGATIGKTRGGVSVGIIGLTTPEQLFVRTALDPEFTITDPVETALRWYHRLAPAVDVLVILSHLGINVAGSRHQSKQDDRLLAHAIARESAATDPGKPPITVVIGGHTHTVIDPHTEPIEVDGVPIFQAGCNMEYVGDVEIDLSARTVRGRLVRLDRLDRRDEQPTPSGEHPRLHQATRNISDAVRTAVLEPVATITSARNANVATTLEDRLSGESAVANMITDALLFRYDRDLRDDRDGTVVVACDASGIQSGLTEENLESRLLRIDDLYRILPYADSIYRAVITPADLERIVRSNIARRIPPAALEPRGGDIGVMDWAKIARGYLHFSRNLRYGTGQSAIVAIDGIPLADLPQDYPITLYCNSFSAMGNQGWSVTDEDAFHEFGSVSLPELGFTDTAIPLRTALIEALRDIGAVTLERDGRHQVRA